MPSSKNATVARFRGIADPLERAAACQEFLTNGRETIKAVQRVRDDAIREARQAKHTGAATVDEIAARIKAKRNVVVDALRQR